MKIEQRTTGYIVYTEIPDQRGGQLEVFLGTVHANDGKRTYGYFSKALARDIARKYHGWYDLGSRTTIKEVVTTLGGGK